MPDNLPIYLLVAAVAVSLIIAIYYYLLRWVFSMKRQLWNQKAQINLLIKIAEKLGVQEELSDIKARNNSSSDEHLN